DFFGGSVGGGIANSHGASLTVGGSTFTGNQEVSAAGAAGTTGGAVDSDAGVNNDVPSSATISSSTFVNNACLSAGQSTGNGGAIDNQGPGVTMTVTDCTVIGNRSVGGAGADGVTSFGEGLGGGLMNVFGTLTIDHTLIIGNQ